MCTNEDDKHPVSNLQNKDVSKKWLCNLQDRTGMMEAIFQLEEPSVISYINIGSIWCATIEVKVGRSDWPAGREFETLIYPVSLMTASDSTMGKNPIKTEMFTTDKFCPEVCKTQWDRLKVICRQPYRKMNQFGLSFLHIKSTAPVTPSSTATPSERKATVSLGPRTSVSSIKQHFLGKVQNGEKKSEKDLKSKLLKIAASSDGGPEVTAVGALSRTAKLVLAASKGAARSGSPVTKTPVSIQRGLQSSHLDQKYGPQFEDEVTVFLSKLAVNPAELDIITLAEIRHRFERKKRRKLTKEEKKKFAELTTEALSSLFDDQPTTSDKTKKLKDDNTGPPLSDIKNLENKHDLSFKSKTDVNRTSTPNAKISKPSIVNETRKVTSTGKRKLNSCDDVVTPPSKKLMSEENMPIKQKMKSVEKKTPVLKVKNRVNEILNENRLGKEHVTDGVSAKRTGGEVNDVKITNSKSVNQKNLVNDFNNMSRKSTTGKDGSFSDVLKTTPLKDSSFGEFLLNVTLSSDDCDSDDEDLDILFPEQKVPKRGKGRGRGRGRGRRKTPSQDRPMSPSVSVLTPGKRGRGRGRGKQSKSRGSSTVNSLEIRPTGFARCEGCGDYYGAELLSIHQGKCVSLKNKQSTSDPANTPWLTSRPDTPGSSSKHNPPQAEKSPPWVMAAIAAEKRLKRLKNGNQSMQESSEAELDSPGRPSGLGDSACHIVEQQRKYLENVTKNQEENISCTEFVSNAVKKNNSQTQSSRVVNQSNSGSKSVSGNSALNNQSTSRKYFDLTLGGDSDSDSNSAYSLNDISQSLARNISNNQSDAHGHFDLLMDDNSRDEQFVPCPLCGVSLPQTVIEMHAANCSL